mgnify:CR=1 FL=1
MARVKADMADGACNLVVRKTARNFDANVAMAGKITVVEVEKLVEIGEIDPDHVHLPSIFVHRIVVNAMEPRPLGSCASWFYRSLALWSDLGSHLFFVGLVIALFAWREQRARIR